MTAADLLPGDLFRFPQQRTRFVMKSHRVGVLGSKWIDAMELDHWGQQRASRCFDPDREVVVLKRAT